MDDPFFAEDDGEFDDFYGNGARASRPLQASKPRGSKSRASPVRQTPSLAYPDTPASGASSFMSKSTDGGLLSVSTATPRHISAAENPHKKHRKLRRKRSQDRFEVAWEKDEDVSACFVCASEFSLLKRKHHCRVELANGQGRQTQGARLSLSDTESVTPNHYHDGGRQRVPTSLRNSIAGVFSSKSADKRNRQDVVQKTAVSASRKNKNRETRADEPTNELFDTSEDAWFVDPVDEGHGEDKNSRIGNKQPPQSIAKAKDSYARPTIVRPPDSLFDVQFTDDNQSDASSEGGKDDFSMPKPSNDAVTSSASARGQDHHVASRRFTDMPMTVDDILQISAPAPSVSIPDPYATALVLVPPIKTATDRTFYNDDADQLVVDEVPGYHESTTRGRHKHKYRNSTPAYSTPALMPRPPAPAPVSDGSSGTLVEAPDMSAPTTQPEAVQSDDREPESKGFAGALKRFFGISKNKHQDASKAPPCATPPSTQVEKPVSTASHQPQQFNEANQPEQLVPVEMPRPEFVPPAMYNHYDAETLPAGNEVETDRGFDGRYTIADVDRFKVEPRGSAASSQLRHTMASYSVQQPRDLANNSLRTSFAGQVVGAPPAKEKHEERKSSRDRRDTFDDLFNSPTKSANSSKLVPPATNLPSRSWAVAESDGRASVGVDRFDRPRRDDVDDDITRNLGLQRGDQDRREDTIRSSTSRTPWSAVNSYRTNTPTFATPDLFTSTRNIEPHGQLDQYQGESQGAIGGVHEFEKEDHPDSLRPIGLNRTIMEDLQPSNPTLQYGTQQQKTSVDDYFADFEKPSDYVFDTASGTYVPANSKPRPNYSIIQNSVPVSHASRSSHTYSNSGSRDGEIVKLGSGVDTLDSVAEDIPDEIDGIIADKISTLAGELEALKHLLRQRRGGKPTGVSSATSSAHRKQSIFDSDGSDEEQTAPAEKISAAKRRPSSRKQKQSILTAPKNAHKKRKDSFAGLFEDDRDDSDSKGILGARNYEALFQVDQEPSRAVGDESDSEYMEKKSRRKSKQPFKHRSESEDESDGAERKEEHKSSSRSRGLKQFTIESEYGLEPDDASARSRQVVDAAKTLPVQNATRTKAKKDAIDSLFDSDTEQDMGQLYETTAANPTPAVIFPYSKDRPDVGESSNSDDENGLFEAKSLPAASQPEANDGGSVDKNAATAAVYKTADMSSDEEFSSTLKNLRARRKTVTPFLRSFEPRLLQDSSDGEETKPSSSLLSVMNGSVKRLDLDPDPEFKIQPREVDVEVAESFALPPHVCCEDADQTADAEDGKLDIGVGRPGMHVPTSTHSSLPDEGSAEVVDEETVVTLGDQEPEHSPVSQVVSRGGQEGDAEALSDTLLALNDQEARTEGFDPLAAVLRDAEGNDALRRTTNSQPSPELQMASAENLGWGTDIGSIGERLKTMRFRDSLLDISPSDAFDLSPSLDVDDLLQDTSRETDNSDVDDSDTRSQSDEEESFSFEIKPKKRSSKETPTTKIPENATQPSTQDLENRFLNFGEDGYQAEVHPPGDAAKSTEGEMQKPEVLERLAEEIAWGSASVASSLDGEEGPSSVDSLQFKDDWQRLQEQEKERKKKLLIKQRQAQREKLKKQPSSGRSLGKSSTSRNLPPSSPSAMSSKTSRIEKDVSEGGAGKKKKKHRKKADEDESAEIGDAKNRRKSDKRKHKRETAKSAEPPVELNVETAPPSSGLTEL